MANKNVDLAIVAKTAEIRAQPYARYIISEEVIERNFGYKIIREQVSQGKNSIIYKCESAKIQNLYCVVKAYKLGKDKIKSSLREETCQIMRYVSGKCQQLITTYDMYYTNDKIYLMCDWSVRGEVLTNMRNKTLKLNEEMLRNWTQDLLAAVTFLHSNAIAHRNISPGCLILTTDNRVKIATLRDAVIYCKPDGSLIKQKWPQFSLSLNWNQPPEVAKGLMYDPRKADIWSIGATIFWFITKTHPIDYKAGTKLTDSLKQRMKYIHKVSRKCSEFVKIMLTFQPSSRLTLTQASEQPWLIAPVSPAAKTAELTAAETAEPGEAVGPDESPAEIEPSNSRSRKEENREEPAQAPE